MYLNEDAKNVLQFWDSGIVRRIKDRHYELIDLLHCVPAWRPFRNVFLRDQLYFGVTKDCASSISHSVNRARNITLFLWRVIGFLLFVLILLTWLFVRQSHPFLRKFHSFVWEVTGRPSYPTLSRLQSRPPSYLQRIVSCFSSILDTWFSFFRRVDPASCAIRPAMA